MKIIVTGGRQRKNGEQSEWEAYDTAIVAIYDTVTQQVEKQISYISPPNVCANELPSIVFKASHLDLEQSTLYVCTQTEVLSFDLPSLEQQICITNKRFNDLHHVCPSSNNNLLVANTGLDMVAEISIKGDIIKEWNVLGEVTEKWYDPDVDYRKVSTTKPHRSHPNYVFILNGKVWVTRFIQKDAICLEDASEKIDIKLGNPHDGCIVDDNIFFTTTNGHIVKGDIHSKEIKEVFNLNKYFNPRDALGWCRGLTIFDRYYAIVGFSRFRETKFKQNINWVKSHVFQKPYYLPTALRCFNLKENKLLWEFNVEEIGINAIFSVNILWD